MRKLALAVVLCGAVLFSGCKSTPSTEVVRICAYVAGQATALVVNRCDLSAEQREALVGTLSVVSAVTPAPGQSVQDTWLPLADAHLTSLVAQGKISEGVRKGALTAFKVVLVGVAVLERRYPVVMVSRNLALAATDGYVSGFLATFDQDQRKLSVGGEGLVDHEVHDEAHAAAVKLGLIDG